MARTAHHLAHKYTESSTPWYIRHRGEPRRQAALYDFRYSRDELDQAAEEGRRPQPRRVRRSFSSWRYMYAYRPSATVGGYMALEEGTARTELRVRLAEIRGLHRAGHDDDFVVVPTNHRHHAVWDAS